MSDDVLARIHASAPRRVIGLGALLGLGGLLLYLALAQPPQGLGWQLFLIVLSGVAFWGAVLMHGRTKVALELTETELRESTGRVLARVDDIREVHRGMMAMKPSNGFGLVMKGKQPAAFAPGLWWRLGRRVAVGGITSGHQTRPVADMLAMMVRERTEQ